MNKKYNPVTNMMEDAKTNKVKDNKTTDDMYGVDIKRLAEYLWTYVSDSVSSDVAGRIFDDAMDEAKGDTLEEKSKAATGKALSRFDDVHKALEREVKKMLDEGYRRNKNRIRKMNEYYKGK